MLNDDADSTGFYYANERDVRYKSYDYTLPTDYNPWSIGYGGGSSQYPFIPITDPSHTFHSASSSRHYVTEEHVIEKDEEDEIDSQDDIDDNENMDEGDDEPLFDIARVNNTEIEYEQDPPDIFTSDQWIDEGMLNNSHEGIDVSCTLEGEEPHGHLITIIVIVANQDIIEVHVEGYNPLITIKMDQLLGLVDNSVLYAQEGHRSQLVYIGQMWHRRRDYIIPPDEDTVGIGRVEYIFWYWSITMQYIGRPDFTYDIRYEPRDHIERSLVEGMKHLHMMLTDGLQDDMISDSTQSRYMAMQMYIDSVLSQVQRTDSSTSDAGPSEPCAGTPQQPDDAGPPQFSPDVMTFSQHGLYDVGASQILTDKDMPDTQPPQSTVGTYRRQRRHRGSTSTLPQQSQSDLLGETLGSISEDMDSETAQSESCDAILVHDTQSETERTDSSTSDAGPSEPCAGTPQQPDDARPPQFLQM
ncbi:hypothetical protein Taro_040262 [Colocasia esculenta]|uniref:Uncharacterized protein n=1 Tax=Colocasia esculenta TaxID=4460 RepID=A0A843WI73_COLES|nr:hypothetical protein [Colocasia esculenta]